MCARGGMADAPDLGSGSERIGGSSPLARTSLRLELGLVGAFVQKRNYPERAGIKRKSKGYECAEAVNPNEPKLSALTKCAESHGTRKGVIKTRSFALLSNFFHVKLHISPDMEHGTLFHMHERR